MTNDELDRLETATKLIAEHGQNAPINWGGYAIMSASVQVEYRRLVAAARMVVDEVCDQTVPNGTTLWCDWCDSTPIGATDPRCEERAPMQHYAECPVGALAALLEEDTDADAR